MENRLVTRRYDFDWLRVLAVLLLIPFHSMHIFILKLYSVVYIKNAEGVPAFEAISQFIHIFHMPLLFVLAGASTYLAFQTRTKKQYIQERVRKLLIPAIAGLVFLIPPMTYIYQISKGTDTSLMMHYKTFFTSNPGDFSGLNGAFTPAHLWFIVFLFVFSAFGIPFYDSLKRIRLFPMRFSLLLYSIPLALAFTLNLLDDKNPIMYFLIFLFGYILMADENSLKAIDRDKGFYLIFGIIFEILLIAQPAGVSEWSAPWVFYGILYHANRLSWVIAILGYGRKYLNHPSAILSYLSQASFPVYILHLPINTIVGFFMVQTGLPPFLKFMIIILLTLVVTYAVYELARKVPILRILLGIQKKKDPSEKQATPKAAQ